MSDGRSSGSGGAGIGTVLLVVFIVLKLTGLIAWSWWWVLSPLWIGAILAVILLAILGVVYMVARARGVLS